MKEYLRVLKKVRDEGYDHEARSGGRRSIFGEIQRYDLHEGFPLVTTRKINTKALVEELLFFIRGGTDNKELNDVGVHIWDKWAVKEDDIKAFAEKLAGADGETDEEKAERARYVDTLVNGLTQNYLGSIGRMYGYFWRNAPQERVDRRWPVTVFKDLPSDRRDSYIEEYARYAKSEQFDPSVSLEQFASTIYKYKVDQLNELVLGLKKRPFSARHVVSAWSPMDVPYEEVSPQENVMLGLGSLAACHAFFQCFVRPGKEPNDRNLLSLMVNIRSNDLPVGAPYNIAQYALLLSMLAQVTDMEAYELIVVTGDTHIYLDQLNLVDKQIARAPGVLPMLKLNPDIKDLFKFKAGDIEIIGYEPQESIAYPVSE